MLLQQLWSEGVKWDDELSNKRAEQWKLLSQDLENLHDVIVPRFSGFDVEDNSCTPSLVCFCDASVKAYATCVYLCWSDKNKKGHTSLLFAKSRLTPIKRQSIPRLELLAVLIGVRALKFVDEQLSIPQVKKYLWSDSQCVLHWIQTEKVQPVFVRNRLAEIKSHKDVKFRYVKSEENPADLPSRGITTIELKDCSLWWEGPQWLKFETESWPTDNIVNDQAVNGPEKRSSVLFEAALLTSQDSAHDYAPLGIDKAAYSTLMSLIRVTAWCRRYILRARKVSKITAKTLCAKELYSARKIWEKSSPQQNFGNVFDAILNSKKNELLTKLNLQIDHEGILRCGERLQNTSFTTEFPVLLPKDDHFTVLIVQDIHARLCHAGVSHTLAQLRQHYWLPEGRRKVQKVLRRCLVCKRWEGGPYKAPPMPPFPQSRVTKTNPFSFTGVDYFGSMYARSKDGRSKVWVCLFTCMTIRAVHLELVDNLSAEDFMLSFRRFVARRGTPKELFSDNATNFRAASDVITTAWRDLLNDPDIHTYVANTGIRWRYVPQSAPWMGGYYERLIGVIKRSLRKTLGKISWTAVQLQTILTEVEAVVNSRPLVYVGAEDNGGYPLSPRHFLSLNTNVGSPSSCVSITADPDFESATNSRTILLQAWKKGQHHLDQFWNKWQQDYLTSLRERSQRLLKQARSLDYSFPKVNDIVLIKDDILPRGSWKIAKVTDLIHSFDGLCRAVKLLLPSRKVTVRPIALLYPLECSNPKVADSSCYSNSSCTFQGGLNTMPFSVMPENFSETPSQAQELSPLSTGVANLHRVATDVVDDGFALSTITEEQATFCSSLVQLVLVPHTSNDCKTKVTNNSRQRVGRQAAKKANERLREWCEDQS